MWFDNPLLPPLLVLVAIGIAVGYMIGFVDNDVDSASELGIYLAAISIGLTGAVFILQSKTSHEVKDIVKKMDDEKKDRKEYVLRGLVNAFRETRYNLQLMRSELLTLARSNGVNGNKQTIENNWKIINNSGVDRIQFLITLSHDVISTSKLDQIETVKNIMKSEYDSDYNTMSTIVSFLLTQSDYVFRDDLKELRLKMAKEEISKLVSELKSGADENSLSFQRNKRRWESYLYLPTDDEIKNECESKLEATSSEDSTLPDFEP
ncbi:hypothetical protein C5F47_05305 [Nitrosopumilus cobalaminigenes]|uniref:Uncharacterized protein n=1 Tax=Nitrosopumilus cobalaminigenes TaxID=1470066 RepID=A0A7D5LZF4_9ARCH|nr:hypothetical protein [Nitrosopumilus cobalaminigenes]QLH03006.1 hypothetical protein C5F47_05305 [Nitrosopumilus cobalaminigenes]